jgi:hypothetical protein
LEAEEAQGVSYAAQRCIDADARRCAIETIAARDFLTQNLKTDSREIGVILGERSSRISNEEDG